MVWPPVAAIRDLLDFFGVGGISRPPGAPNGPKTRKSGFSRSWGPFWAKCLQTKFDCMLNADPVNPVRGPTCPWDPRYGRFGGGWGPFRRLGTGCVCWEPNRQKTVSSLTRRHRSVFGNVLARRNCVCVAQFSYSDDVGGFHLSFSRKSRFTGFWRGLGT